MSKADTKFHGQGDGSVIIQHKQDVGAVLKENKEMRDHHGGNIEDDMKLAARVPMVLLEKWRNEENLDYHMIGRCPEMTARFWKKLQDPSWRNLRVWDGKVV